MTGLGGHRIGGWFLTVLAVIGLILLVGGGQAEAQTQQVDVGASAVGASPVSRSATAIGHLTQAPPAGSQLGDSVKQDARHFGWPIVIAILVAAFLSFQGRAEKSETKLADAPLDQGERLRFR